MKKNVRSNKSTIMFPEYDFRHGVRGKHAKCYAEGTNIVMLDPVVSKFFPLGRWPAWRHSWFNVSLIFLLSAPLVAYPIREMKALTDSNFLAATAVVYGVIVSTSSANLPFDNAPPFENFRFQVLEVLKGSDHQGKGTYSIDATALDWPRGLVPFAPGSRCILILRYACERRNCDAGETTGNVRIDESGVTMNIHLNSPLMAVVPAAMPNFSDVVKAHDLKQALGQVLGYELDHTARPSQALIDLAFPVLPKEQIEHAQKRAQITN